MLKRDAAEDHILPRRRRRVLAAGCGGTLAVFMVSLFTYLGWVNALPPPEPLPPRTLPHPNGYAAVLEAAAALEALEAGLPPLGPPWKKDLTTLRCAVARRKPALDQLRAAISLPYYTPPYDPLVADGACPEIYNVPLRFWAESRIARADGQMGEAMQHSLDAIELGAKLGRGAPLSGVLMGQNSISWGLDSADRCFDSLSASAAREAGQRLDRIRSQMATMADTMTEQRVVELMQLRQHLAERPQLSLIPQPGARLPLPPTGAVWNYAVRMLCPKLPSYSRWDAYRRGVIEEARKPYPQRRFPSRDLAADPVLGRPQLWDAVRHHSENVSYDFARVETSMCLLRVRLALQEYHSAYGAFPESLAAISESLAPEVLVDPLSEKPLRYRREGSAFVLYSVGPDGKDDGGRPVRRLWDESAHGDLVAGKVFPKRKGEIRP